MIICPSCNSENPGDYRFCQQCGDPLQVWRAFLVPCLADGAKPTLPTGDRLTAADQGDPAQPHLYSGESEQLLYLDRHRRYQLQAPLPQCPPDQAIEISVVDCQPAAPSPIAEIQASWLQNPSQDANPLDSETSLPAEALPYLALQADFFPIVPELHDAWLTLDYAVILIEDRSRWPLFQDCWQQERDRLQRITWLYEITLLWDALAPWGARDTLLSLNRLRVDDDQILCLECLSNLPANQQPSLTDLGQAWQTLSQGDTSLADLNGLIDDLANGNLADTENLKQRLAQMADQLQASAIPANQSASLPVTAPPPELADETLAQFPSRSEAQGGEDQAADSEARSLASELPDFEAIPAADADDAIATTNPLNLEDWQDTEEDSDTIDSPTMVLPMKLVQVSEIGRTYVGRQREHNEDCYCAQTNLQKCDSPQGEALHAKGIYILCDGMGGHASGEVASELAVKTLMEFFAQHWQASLPSQEVLQQGVIAANQAIYEINQSNSSLGSGRMGTTLVMVLLQDTQAVVVNVGDSRLYTYNRRLGLNQVTVDHEVGQREIQRGVEPAIAYARPDAYQLTQALGPRSQKDLRPDITYIDVLEDTLFLLCSDGLSDNELIERNCATYIKPLLRSQADLEQGVTKLIGLANERNGHDNITAILVRVKLKPDMDKLPG